MKIAVVGSRNIMCDVEKYIPHNTTLIISGGAKGIDLAAEQYADRHGIPKLILRPNYAMYGKVAPLKRNELIVDYCDKVIALWDGKSKGTEYTINFARKNGKEVEIYIL